MELVHKKVFNSDVNTVDQISVLSKLDERARQILELRFPQEGNRLTLKEIGERVGLSPERVRQIERDSLKVLHGMIEQPTGPGQLDQATPLQCTPGQEPGSAQLPPGPLFETKRTLETCRHCREVFTPTMCRLCGKTPTQQCMACHVEIVHGIILNQNIHIVGNQDQPLTPFGEEGSESPSHENAMRDLENENRLI